MADVLQFEIDQQKELASLRILLVETFLQLLDAQALNHELRRFVTVVEWSGAMRAVESCKRERERKAFVQGK